MNKIQALIFAIISVSFLLGVSISLAHRNGWAALISFLLFIALTGIGFVYKARQKRKDIQTNLPDTNESTAN